MKTALIVALVLPLTLVAQEPAKTAEPPKATAEAPAKAELKVGTAVENKDVVGAAEKFKVAADTRLWAWARVSGLQPGSKVTLAFVRGDKEVFRKEMTAAAASWRVNANRTFRAGDGGTWTAKLLGPDGAELASATFEVEIQK